MPCALCILVVCAMPSQAQEVTALRRAFKRLDASYTPRVTFIVVQKRHHTRFFAMNRQDSDRSGNPLRK